MFPGTYTEFSAVFCRRSPLLVLAHDALVCILIPCLWFQAYLVVFSAAVISVPERLLRPVMQTARCMWQQSGCALTVELALLL